MPEPTPPEAQPLLANNVDIEGTPVYPLIHMIREDAIHYIDTPLTYEALFAPDLTYTLVRPLVEKYLDFQHDGNYSVTFCCLINRVHFLRDDNMTTATISRSRANLCEILAIRVFRSIGNNLLKLTIALTTSWPVYSGADPELLAQYREDRDDDLEDRVGNAIEMAILGKSKRFIKSSACQKVINAIWSGQCVYQAESSHSILSDTYKRTPIHFYDPHKAPLLDHYRLKVPAIRSVLDYINFLMLFFLFIIALEYNKTDYLNMAEIAFMIYALGFTLEKVAAMQEHGIKVYFKGTWNGFDLAFITTYVIYASLRIYGVYHCDHKIAVLGVDVLSLIACLMFPRLAFVTFKDNLLVLSLRAMIIQFSFLMMIAAFCFLGFLYALWSLSRDTEHYSPGLVSWWMLDLWFGLDATGFDKASTFHPIFGPLLMVTYACLSNTLLLTVLVSILSNTFASVNNDAAAEAMFRKAVLTIEGVKADSLFSYQPPVNLLALCVMLPASYMLTPRWFHKVNVFMIRVTSFPLLLAISFYERQAKSAGAGNFYGTVAHAAERVFETLPRSLKRMTFFEGLAGAGPDIDAVFELATGLEDSALDIGDNNDDFSMDYGRRRLSGTSGRRLSGQSMRRSGGISMGPASGHGNSHGNGNGNGTGNGQNQEQRLYTPPSLPKLVLPRPRLNSALSRAHYDGPPAMHQTYSPLAQVYQNQLALDGVAEQVNVHMYGQGQGQGLTDGRSTEGSSVVQGISYGRATRRRIMSMNNPQGVTSLEGNGAGHGAATGGQQAALHPFRTSPFNTSPEAPPGPIQRSRSQDPAVARKPYDNLGIGHAHVPHPHAGPETASAVMSAESETGETPEQAEVIERLKDMEDRQRNIESLLSEIVKSLGGGRGAGSLEVTGEEGGKNEEGGNGPVGDDSAAGGEAEGS